MALQVYSSNNSNHHEETAATSTTTTINNINNNSNTSAACLLVMDDNHRLVEWLAYHHFTTNLRYIIVAVDPRSSTSPKAILERWQQRDAPQQNNINAEFQYEIWGDDDYMGARVLDKRKRLDDLGRKQLTMVHRVRQKAFYQYCLERLDAIDQKTWTLLLDVDEYLVVNSNDDKANVTSATTTTTTANKQHAKIMSTPGGVYHYLQDMAQQAARQPDSTQYEQFSSPCIAIPRLLFGTNQDSDDVSSQTAMAATKELVLPAHIYNQLDTMRWFYHAHYAEFDRNGLGKTILDLSRIPIPKPHFPHPVNPHRPFQDLCRDPKQIKSLNQNALLRVHHYISTWETYSFRNDSRKGAERSREAWEFRALASKGGKTTDIVPWLEGFVRHHGDGQAAQLLEGAGLPTTYTHPPQVNDQWNFLFAQDFLDKQKNSQQYDSNYGQFLRSRTTMAT